jgi:hypothetical protein
VPACVPGGVLGFLKSVFVEYMQFGSKKKKKKKNMQEKFKHLHSSLTNAIEKAFDIPKMKCGIMLSIPFYPEQISSLHACVCITSFVTIIYMMAILTRLSKADISTRMVQLMSVESHR